MLNLAEIGKIIVILREREGLTQEKLVSEAEISVAYPCRVEHSRVNPTLRALDRATAMLEMELSTPPRLSGGRQKPREESRTFYNGEEARHAWWGGDNMKIHSKDAYHLLYRLGATANYTGSSYLVWTLQLYAEEPERLLLVTKWLCPDVTKQYGANWRAMERDIRVVDRVIWNSDRPLLETLAHRRLSQKSYTA